MYIEKIVRFIDVCKHIRLRNMHLSMGYPDRILLEDKIIPHYASSDSCNRILFIGCAWYTKFYEYLFMGKEYWTIEPDFGRSQYGSKKHHIQDTLQNLSFYVDSDFFDLIIYTGVFGWGIDTKPDAELAFEQCYRSLSQSGTLVFGWNDIPEHKPFDAISESIELQKFHPICFPPLQTHHYMMDDDNFKHVFNFFSKSKIDEIVAN
jgi:hypothetical protein